MTISKDEFRQVMSLFATGVTVITSRVDDGMYGMTANAVTSVSLEPMLLLVCMDHNSVTYEVLKRAGVFGVNILSNAQEAISRRFAVKRQPGENQFEGLSYSLSQKGCPILEGSLGFIECKVATTHPAGDHTLFLGEVIGAEAMEEGLPLLFYRSRYAKLPA